MIFPFNKVFQSHKNNEEDCLLTWENIQIMSLVKTASCTQYFGVIPLCVTCACVSVTLEGYKLKYYLLLWVIKLKIILSLSFLSLSVISSVFTLNVSSVKIRMNIIKDYVPDEKLGLIARMCLNLQRGANGLSYRGWEEAGHSKASGIASVTFQQQGMFLFYWKRGCSAPPFVSFTPSSPTC